MRLLPERLDDRGFEDLFEEARALIPRFAPAWTDHNTHDPGISLLELWAWLAEGQLYRLERVTARHREAFLAMLGARRRDARPARVVVIPGDPAPAVSRRLPAGTRLALDRDRDVVFTTEHETWLTPARVRRIVAAGDGEVSDVTAVDRDPQATYLPFGPDAAAGSQLLLEIDPGPAPACGEPRRCRLQLTARVARPQDAGGSANGVYLPAALAWEIRSAGRWRPAAVVEDTTRSLTRSGRVTILVTAAGPLELRVRIAAGAYDWAPELRRLCLNGIAASQVEPRHLAQPALTGRRLPLDDLIRQAGGVAASQLVPDEKGRLLRLLSERASGWTEWQPVPTLADSGPEDHHYVLDRERRELCFGDGINGRSPFETAIDAVHMRLTHGSAGNVEAGREWVLTDGELTGAAWVNPEPARGGADRERLDEAEDRVRRSLESEQQRAVTAADYRRLALATPGARVARAHAVFDAHPAFPGRVLPGQVMVVAVARRRPDAPRRLESPAFLKTVAAHLERHRLLGDQVHVVAPEYRRVAVRCTLHVRPGHDGERVRRAALEELARRLAAVGPEGAVTARGWPFGKDLQRSQVAAWLDDLEGVEYVDGLELSAGGTAVETVTLGPRDLPLSGAHDLEISHHQVPRSPAGRQGGCRR